MTLSSLALGRTAAESRSGSRSVIAGHTYILTLTSHDDDKVGDPTYTLYDDVALA